MKIEVRNYFFDTCDVLSLGKWHRYNDVYDMAHGDGTPMLEVKFKNKQEIDISFGEDSERDSAYERIKEALK